MTDPIRAAPPELVASEGAALGSGDPTRRWALRFPGGRERFAGVTRIEGWAATAAVAAMGDDEADRCLIAITLPVVLSDGAGPHLVDAAGRLVLALGPHPHLDAASVAMGEASPQHSVGALERVGEGPLWRWIAHVRVAPADRISALDALDAALDRPAAGAWEREWERHG